MLFTKEGLPSLIKKRDTLIELLECLKSANGQFTTEPIPIIKQSINILDIIISELSGHDAV